MNHSILFSNYKEFKEKKETLKKDGPANLAVIADFDRTLSSNKYNSMMAALQDTSIYSDEYASDSKNIFEKYYPQERDPNKSHIEKTEIMLEWWKVTYDFWKKHNLSKTHIDEIIDKTDFELRTYVAEFFALLKQHSVPSVILSASGFGLPAIPAILKKYRIDMESLLIISNEIEWDKNDRFHSVKEPIIHSSNKTIIAKSSPQVQELILPRSNLVVVGDSISDADMKNCIPHKTALSIGILEEPLHSHLQKFKEAFDVVLFGDVCFEFSAELLEDICTHEKK